MRQRRLCDSSVQQTLLRFLRAADPPRAKDKTRSAAKDEPSSEKRACAPAWLGALLASGPELISPTEPPPRVPRFRGKRDEKDRDAELPWLLREAMATAVGRLVLRRPGAGGGARWSEFFFFFVCSRCGKTIWGAGIREREGMRAWAALVGGFRSPSLRQTCPHLPGSEDSRLPSQVPCFGMWKKSSAFLMLAIDRLDMGIPPSWSVLLPSRPFPTTTLLSFPIESGFRTPLRKSVVM